MAIRKSQKLKKAPTRKPAKTPTGKFLFAKGGRKSATAQVRVYPGNKGFLINNKDYKDYFPYDRQQVAVLAPLKVVEGEKDFSVTVVVHGSGFTGQAEAIRHGLATALANHDEEFKKKLKREGFLTRDSRSVERKKPGLRKARRRPQWSKR